MILRSTHITSLIHDTKSHERILFTVPSAPSHTTPGPSTARAPRRNTAVAVMLGKDMVDQLRKGGAEVTTEMLRREEEEIAELEKQRAKIEDEIKMMDMEMGRNIHSFGAS